jgi:hypothetical protein
MWSLPPEPAEVIAHIVRVEPALIAVVVDANGGPATSIPNYLGVAKQPWQCAGNEGAPGR